MTTRKTQTTCAAFFHVLADTAAHRGFRDGSEAILVGELSEKYLTSVFRPLHDVYEPRSIPACWSFRQQAQRYKKTPRNWITVDGKICIYIYIFIYLFIYLFKYT